MTSSNLNLVTGPRWFSALTIGRSTPRGAFWLSFVAFLLVASAWALSNPLMASVDEPAHVIKAAATVRAAPDTAGTADETGIGTVVLPNLYAQLALYPNCFAFHSEQPASCQQDLSGDLDAPTPTTTSAYNYNPMYYAVVGLPSLLPVDGEWIVYAMRLVNALVSALVLALAVRTVAELPRRRWLGLGLLLAVTPTFVNLLGSVNPQSIEAVGSVLLWTSLLALLWNPDRDLTGRRLVRLVLATALVSNARGLGPFFVALIVVIALMTVPWASVRNLFADRRAWWGLTGGVVVTALATAWIVGGDALPEGPGTGVGRRDALVASVRATSDWAKQIVAALGWLDVSVPDLLYFTAAAAIGLPLVFAVSIGTWRDRITLLALVGLVFAVPVAIQTLQYPSIGYFWQGRYVFPLSIGALVLVGFVLDHRDDFLPDPVRSRVVAILAHLVGLINVVAFAFNLHRYVNGVDGGWFSLDARSWVPLAHPLVLLGVYAAVWFVAVTVVLRATPTQRLVR
ncbi:DUF2142 domain-containing protein [Antribacter gilvus]|uniref:DUF2142 domain-containing protein n=1 Tax=Antribacter gilvus TaxID=2304675 RepID=UPI000F7690F3|nr:DUF2142 domain-containing protein [Antribacter gilvus]